MHQESSTAQGIPVRCFKCREGCIHLEYGNALFTFTQQQFCLLAEVIGETHRRVLAESEPNVESLEFTESLVM
ncbi:MAG: hypothetical protein ABI977_12905 [Acidobacteriota bacterium]